QARDRIAGLRAAGGWARRGSRRAIVALAVADRVDVESTSANVSSRGSASVERVVAGIGAADRNAADRYRLAGANILVGEAGAGIAVGEQVAGDPVVRQRHRGHGRAVVDPVHTRGADD